MGRFQLINTVLLSIIAGCGSRGRPAAVPVATARPSEPVRGSIVATHMRDHYDGLLAMERYLVDGDLPAVRDYAVALAVERADPALAPWEQHLAQMRAAAESLGQATGTAEAARRLPRVAATCAGCHRETGADVDLPQTPVPADLPTALARMDRHQWAADRLWQGMIASSDQAWRDGLEVLARSPLPTSELATMAAPSAVPRVRELGDQLRRIAKQARSVGSLDRRAVALGEVLVVCAGCHELARGRTPEASPRAPTASRARGSAAPAPGS